MWFVLAGCHTEPKPPDSEAPVGELGLAQIAVRLTSVAPSDMSGQDIDGDGAGDLVIAGSGVDVIVRPLSSGSVESRGDHLDIDASWVTGLGDADGDGVGDLAFGVTFGAVWVCRSALDSPVAGWISGARPGTVAGWIEDPDYRPKNVNTDLFYRVAGPGDLNGDGRADLVVVMDEVWVFHGPLPTHALVGDADLTITVDSTYIVSEDLGVGGDWNGDGRRDLALSTRAFGVDPVVYLVDGDGSGTIPLEQATFGTLAVGTFAPDPVVNGAGDIDGDGADDLVVPSFNGASIVWGPVSGAQTGESLVDGVDGDGSDVVQSIAVAGDLDADGFADLVLGAPGPESEAGSVAVVYGPIYGRVDYDDADARLIGEATESGAGTLVVPVDDADADGYADFAVAATDIGHDYPSGAVYLVFGGAR